MEAQASAIVMKALNFCLLLELETELESLLILSRIDFSLVNYVCAAFNGSLVVECTQCVCTVPEREQLPAWAWSAI